jgi:hypothetical protein
VCSSSASSSSTRSFSFLRIRQLTSAYGFCFLLLNTLLQLPPHNTLLLPPPQHAASASSSSTRSFSLTEP